MGTITSSDRLREAYVKTHEHPNGTEHSHKGGDREHSHSADRDPALRRRLGSRRGAVGLRYGISGFGYMYPGWTAQTPPLNGDQFNGEATSTEAGTADSGTGGDGGGGV